MCCWRDSLSSVFHYWQNERFRRHERNHVFEVARILQHHQPKAILLENVKQLVSHDGGKTFKVILDTLAELGYSVKWKILNALDFGLPQKRACDNRGL